jgi:hypothetical protein
MHELAGAVLETDSSRRVVAAFFSFAVDVSSMAGIYNMMK